MMHDAQIPTADDESLQTPAGVEDRDLARLIDLVERMGPVDEG